jgi:hypothetical protein
MCNKYSFLLTRAGKILDGGGLTESHSEIATLHGVDEDKCNRYEWQPPVVWPVCSNHPHPFDKVMDGLFVDKEVFTPGASALKRIAAHLSERFPTHEAFATPTPVDDCWHAQRVVLGGRETTILCKPGLYEASIGAYRAYGNSQVTAQENSQVTAWEHSQVTAWEHSQVTAWDHSQVAAWGNSQVTAYGSSQVTAYGSSQVTAYGSSQVAAWENSQVTAWGNSQVTAYGSSQVAVSVAERALLIDRRDSKLVITSAVVLEQVDVCGDDLQDVEV